MRNIDGALRLSASDLMRFKGCRHATSLDLRRIEVGDIVPAGDGEEVRGSADDALTVNENTGVLSVHRVDGFEEVTTHYSPSAWAWVTHRVKQPGGRR